MTKRGFVRVLGLAALAWPACTTTWRRAPRLDRLRGHMAVLIEREMFPGAVWLVARGREVTVDAAGVSAIGGTMPMRRDTIFRIASMTKPITAAAMMMLAEEEKLTLEAPVERWLPELATARAQAPRRAARGHRTRGVARSPCATCSPSRSASASCSIRRRPIRGRRRTRAAMGAPVPMTPHAPDEWMRRFGTLPLMHQPGERWMYNTGSLLQACWSRGLGGRLEDFLRDRIFEPLGCATQVSRAAGQARALRGLRDLH